MSKRVSLLEMSPEVLEKIFRHRKSPSIAEEIMSLEIEDQLQIARTLETTPLPTHEVRRMVKTIKLMKSSDEKFQDTLGVTWKAQMNNRHFVLKCIDQTISALRLALTRMDSVLDKLGKRMVGKRDVTSVSGCRCIRKLDSLIRLEDERLQWLNSKRWIALSKC